MHLGRQSEMASNRGILAHLRMESYDGSHLSSNGDRRRIDNDRMHRPSKRGTDGAFSGTCTKRVAPGISIILGASVSVWLHLSPRTVLQVSRSRDRPRITLAAYLDLH